MGTPPSGRIAHLQGIRAVAVTLVVLFHLDELLPGGFVGVDVFFVLSGYLVVGRVAAAARRGTEPDVGGFLRRRLWRLAVPLAGTLTAVLLVAPFVVRAGGEAERLLRVAVANVLGVANLELYRQQDYFAPVSEASHLLHTWSLGVELQFYVAFALILVVMRRRLTRASAVRDLGFALAASGLASLGLAVALSLAPGAVTGLLDHPVDGFFYLSPARFWQFAAGGLLAVRRVRGPSSDVRHRSRAAVDDGAAVLALGALMVAAVTFGGAVRYSALLALVPTGATVVLISVLRRPGPIRGLLSSSTMVRIGDRSYSIYLWHWPFLTFATAVGLGIVGHIVALLLSLVAAEVSYRVLEPIGARRPDAVGVGIGPGRRSRSHRIQPALASALPLALLVNMGLIAASGSVSLDGVVPTGSPGDAEGCEPLLDAAGPRSPSRLLLVGDSHAGSLAPELGPCLRSIGVELELAVQPGCSALAGVVAEDPQVAGRCDPWQREVLASIAADPPEHVVVLTYATARTSLVGRGEVLPEFRIRSADGTPATDVDSALALYEEGLGGFVAAVVDLGPEVLLLTTLPDFEGEVVRAPRLIRAANGAPYVLEPTPALGAERLAAVNRVEGSVAARTGASILRTERVLCRSSCAQVSETGALLFRDSDHLAPAGARRLARAVTAAILEGG